MNKFYYPLLLFEDSGKWERKGSWQHKSSALVGVSNDSKIVWHCNGLYIINFDPSNQFQCQMQLYPKVMLRWNLEDYYLCYRYDKWYMSWKTFLKHFCRLFRWKICLLWKCFCLTFLGNFKFCLSSQWSGQTCCTAVVIIVCQVCLFCIGWMDGSCATVSCWHVTLCCIGQVQEFLMFLVYISL